MEILLRKDTLISLLILSVLMAGCSKDLQIAAAPGEADKTEVPTIGENTMQEMSVLEIKTIRIGQTENRQAGTGCTVFLCPEGMRTGLDVRSGDPASRESQLVISVPVPVGRISSVSI